MKTSVPAKSLKIVLVQPPVEDLYFTPHRSSALGLQALKDVWTKRGHNCQILNFTLEKPLKKKLPLPDELAYLGSYLTKQTDEMIYTSFFNNSFRFGPSLKNCLERIVSLDPQVVAVSCFAWSYAETTRKLCEILRHHWHDSQNPPLIVVGGAGVSVLPFYFTAFADLVVKGEGENAITVIEKIAGRKSYSIPGEIVSPPPPTAVPLSLKIINRRKNYFSAAAMLTRGCPKMCSFCSNYLLFGRTLRKADIGEVFAGLGQLVDEVLVRSRGENAPCKLHLNFEDDNILLQKKYFLEILQYIKEKCDQSKIEFSFTAENGMDYLLLDLELLKAFKELNLKQLNLSIASMDQKQMEVEKRTVNLKKLELLLELSEKLVIPVITYFICGLEKDNPVKAVETISYLHHLKTIIGISLYYPVPGLTGWEDMELFLKVPPYLCRGSSAYPWNRSLTTRDMITAFRLARTSNYLNRASANRNIAGKLELNLLNDKTLNKPMVELFFREVNTIY